MNTVCPHLSHNIHYILCIYCMRMVPIITHTVLVHVGIPHSVFWLETVVLGLCGTGVALSCVSSKDMLKQ